MWMLSLQPSLAMRAVENRRKNCEMQSGVPPRPMSGLMMPRRRSLTNFSDENTRVAARVLCRRLRGIGRGSSSRTKKGLRLRTCL